VSGELLRVGQVAALMSVSPMTVYRMIRAGELPAVRIGRAYRVESAAVRVYLDRHHVGWVAPG
jgi:excisionase family DNA binding protein